MKARRVRRAGAPERRPFKRNLREVCIREKTRRRYRTMVREFFVFLFAYKIPLARSVEELDGQGGRYLEHLWEDDRPEGWATDFVSGLKRLLPAMRKQLYVTSFLLANWRKSLQRRRAMPLTQAMVRALAGFALFRGRKEVAACICTAFAGLLRSGEIKNLRWTDLVFCAEHKAVILFLRDTKSGNRANKVERVLIEEPEVCLALRAARAESSGGGQLYPGSMAGLQVELRRLAGELGLPLRRLSLYSLCRGGATHHFMAHRNLSHTAAFGRWEHEKTARIYIDEAGAQLNEWQLGAATKRRISKAAAVADAAFGAWAAKEWQVCRDPTTWVGP